MEKFALPKDLCLFGNRIPNFPIGIKEGFDMLIAMLPEGHERHYYGVSWMQAGEVIYYTMAGENFPGESKQYAHELNLTVEKGEYLTTTVYNWMSKTASIKSVFEGLMENKSVATDALCIEWYKSDEEMVCMVRKR